MKVWAAVSTTLAALAAIFMAGGAAVKATTGGFRLHPLPRAVPAVCTCDPDLYMLDEGVARCQLASDFLIALAYFSIPLELLYFFIRSKIFPFRWILVQFGLFIVLCGLTHLVAIWTYGPHPRSIAITQTALKVLTAVVSCATAVLLVHIIPALLNIKVRELFLQHKAAQLDREMGVIRRQEEVGRHVRILTHEIRSTLDRHTILNTTLVELANTLDLENCCIWTPNADGTALELTHELKRRLVQVPISISVFDSTVQAIIRNNRAVQIPPTSLLGRACAPWEAPDCSLAAVRLPLLPVYGSPSPENSEATFAIMVLVLPGQNNRQWRPHEVEMVEVVGDQVAVALSHAAVLEESQRTRDEMVERNRALQLARQKAELAVKARNDFLAVMNHELRTPLHAVIGITSILQEGRNIPEECRPQMETALRSSRLLSTLIGDVLHFSRLEEGSIHLAHAPFDLRVAFHEAGRLAWPLARAKGLAFSLHIADDVPAYVVGDERRLLQATLSIMGNAFQYTEEGSIWLEVTVEGKNGERGPPESATWQPTFSDRHVYVRVQVRDTGRDHGDAGERYEFQAFGQESSVGAYGGSGLGLAICKRFVELMDGHMWVAGGGGGGAGEGSSVAFVARLQLDPLMRGSEAPPLAVEMMSRELAGLRVLVVDDSYVNRLATQRMLEVLECDVTAAETAGDCLAALTTLETMPFDIVILDLCMPEADGFDVARKIQHAFRSDDCPIMLALTARTDAGIQESCLEAGFDAVLLKPMDLRELGATMCDLIRSNGVRPPRSR